MESYHCVYEQWQPTYKQYSYLLHRRQTANTFNQLNAITFVEPFVLTDDEFQIATTKLRSPIGSNAMRLYRYTLRQRRSYNYISNNDSVDVADTAAYAHPVDKELQIGGRFVYIIDVEPMSSLISGFTGTLMIDSRNFAVVGMRLRPTASTGLPLIRSCSFEQRIEPFGDSLRPVWMTTFFSSRIHLGARTYILGSRGMVITTEISSRNMRLLDHVADTVFVPPRITDSLTAVLEGRSDTRTVKLRSGNYLTIAEDPNNDDPDFWKTKAMSVLTPREEYLLGRADSLKRLSLVDKVIADILKEYDFVNTDFSHPLTVQKFFPLNMLVSWKLPHHWSVGLTPVLFATRINRASLGLSASVGWKDFSLQAHGLGSVLGPGWWQVQIRQILGCVPDGEIAFEAMACSQLQSIQPKRWTDPIIGPLFGFTYENAYFITPAFDFFREDGIRLSATYITSALQARVVASLMQQRSVTTSVEGERWNPAITDGTFAHLRAEIAWNYKLSISPLAQNTDNFHAGARLMLASGIPVHAFTQNTGLSTFSEAYHKAEMWSYIIQPTVLTGYTPMHLLLTLQVGLSSNRTSLQERFVMMPRYVLQGVQADFLSSGFSAFSGMRYLSLRAEHNFSDLAWRALGLPTYKGRGLDVILHAGAARYEQATDAHTSHTTGFPPPTNGWYTELGFGIGRIPLVVIDILTLRLDAAWGVGNIAAGRFGWSVGFNASL